MIKQKREKCTFLSVVTGGGLFGHCKFVVVLGKWTKWKIDVWIIKILNVMVKIINFLVCLCLHNNLTDKMIGLGILILFVLTLVHLHNFTYNKKKVNEKSKIKLGYKLELHRYSVPSLLNNSILFLARSWSPMK